MNRIRKLTLAFSAAIPAVAMLGGTAFAGGGAEQAIQYTDLVVNGKFTTNTLGWTAGPQASIAAKEGNALVYNTMPVAAVTSTKEVTQCVEIEPNSQPTFKGSIYIPAGQVRTGSASFKLTYYDNTDCTDFKGNSQVPALVTTGHWRHTEFKLDPWTAKDAKSVLIAMQVTKNHGKPLDRGKKFVAVFDNIKLLQKLDPIQPDDDKVACTDICIDEDDAPPPPPAVEPDDSEDEPVVEEEPADAPAEDEAEDDSDDTPEDTADDAPSGDADQSDDPSNDEPGDDEPSTGGTDTPSAPGTGGSNQPGAGNGNGNNPSANGGTPTTNNPVDATSGGDTKSPGGETSKPNTNNGSASKTPLAPETGSNAQAEESESTNAMLFGAVAGALAALSFFFAFILKRRANRRTA